MGDYSIEHDTLTALGDGVRHVVASEAQMTPVEMAEALNNYKPPKVSGEPEKQINFIDYDGTIVASYTAEEWASVTELPEKPEHDKLTAQGWNWTKAQIDAQLTSAPTGPVWIGQMYVTKSGDTEIDITLRKGRLSPYFSCAVNGTVTIDWGDGSTHSEVTGTSLTTQINTNHQYASAGDYTIKIHVEDGSWSFYGTSSFTLLNGNSGTTNANRVYSACVRAVRIGNDTYIGAYAFYYCYNLTSVTIPREITGFGEYTFSYTYALTSATLPSGISAVGQYLFYYGYGLSSVSIPAGVESIESNSFYACYRLTTLIVPYTVTSIKQYAVTNAYNLASLTIPAGVTDIANYGFSGCYGIGEYHFLSTTPPTLGGTSVFQNIQSDCKIYVPKASVDTYKAANRWSSHASKIYGE